MPDGRYSMNFGDCVIVRTEAMSRTQPKRSVKSNSRVSAPRTEITLSASSGEDVAGDPAGDDAGESGPAAEPQPARTRAASRAISGCFIESSPETKGRRSCG